MQSGARLTDTAKVKHGVLQHFTENAPKINTFAGIIRAVWHEYCCGEGVMETEGRVVKHVSVGK